MGIRNCRTAYPDQEEKNVAEDMDTGPAYNTIRKISRCKTALAVEVPTHCDGLKCQGKHGI